jgi:hypothetical protein
MYVFVYKKLSENLIKKNTVLWILLMCVFYIV